MAEGYEDIDKYVTSQNQGLDQQLQTMNDIADKSTQLQTERLARQKEDIDRETVQQNRAIYQDYKKNGNPFGQQAENLASQGLGNSGYAETTQARMYNTYQNNITSTLNTARQLKADVDFAINEAIKTGDITKGENALKIYAQRMQLASEEFDLRNNREQILYQRQYQRDRDAIEDKRWQTEFDYNKSVDDRNYKYQLSRDKIEDKYRKDRDKVSDSQWQKEYELSKKSLATSSSRRSSGSGSRRTYKTQNKNNNGDQIKTDDNLSKSAQNVMNNVEDLIKGVAKEGMTVGSVIANLKKGNLSGALKTVKNTATNSVYNAWKNNIITDEEADAITKKLGL